MAPRWEEGGYLGHGGRGPNGLLLQTPEGILYNGRLGVGMFKGHGAGAGTAYGLTLTGLFANVDNRLLLASAGWPCRKYAIRRENVLDF